MKRLQILVAAATALTLSGAEPSGYYSSCEGKSGEALLKALADVVSPHTNVGYDGLWEVYLTSDVRPDGTLWDIYTTKHWETDFTRCGNYKLIGDCVNREHSFPKSWWGGGKLPQYSDAYHLYPTDGKVNGQRSNYPYGECAGGKSLPDNGSVKALGRLGASTFAGYSGTVFEPDDEYKGDLARSFFYLAAAYNSSIAGWTQGNGGEMLAGNSYPVFQEWTVNMFLKWCRQDPVSEKEQNRNDAINLYQQNRNPFIDYPELVEYIWGNRKGTAWYAGAGTDPAILTPSDKSTVDMGLSSTGRTRTVRLTVKGAGLTEDVKATVSGTGFGVSPSVLPVDEVNGAGAGLTLTYLSSSAGSGEGTLTLESGNVKNSCVLTCSTVDGLPAGEAVDVTESSFVATWTCIDDPTDYYTVNVTCHGDLLDEFPTQVRAGEEMLMVEGLDPETEYIYTVSNGTLISRQVAVTTLAPVPSIQLLYDGELAFAALPGEPSEIAEILVDADNVPGDITVTVEAPFRVSTDKTDWSTSVTLTPDEDRFYMQLLAYSEGVFTTSVVLTADGYMNDDVEVTGTVGNSATDFLEDFEPVGSATYAEQTYRGSACTWLLTAYFERYPGDNAYPHSGEQAARTNKSGNRHFTMLESKPDGIGTLSFWAHLWRSDATAARFDVLKSTDDGSTWESVGVVEIPATPGDDGTNVYAEYSLAVDQSGPVRIKLNQTAGGRVMVDDICLTSYPRSGIGAANAAEYHSWDAYSLGGELILESDGRSADEAAVYSVDGTLVFSGLIPTGSVRLSVAPGLYLVTVRDFTRRVVVK